MTPTKLLLLILEVSFRYPKSSSGPLRMMCDCQLSASMYCARCFNCEMIASLRCFTILITEEPIISHSREQFSCLGNVFCSNLSNTLVLDHIQLLIAQYFPRDWKVEDTSNLVLLMNTSLVFEHPNIDSWTMLRIDLEHRKILYCDPRLVRSPALSEFAKLSLERTRTEILIPVLRVVVPTYTGDWPLSILEHQYFPTLAATNECDCGVYLAACLYFSVNTVPVYINENGGIARLRKQLAYWILCEQLPY